MLFADDNLRIILGVKVLGKIPLSQSDRSRGQLRCLSRKFPEKRLYATGRVIWGDFVWVEGSRFIGLLALLASIGLAALHRAFIEF